jgi:predicted ester cyclase
MSASSQLRSFRARVLAAVEELNDPTLRSPFGDTAYCRLHAPTCVAHGYAPHALDRDALVLVYEEFWQAFPDIHVSVEALAIDGNLLAGHFTYRATHEGPFMNVAPTGKRVILSAMGFQRVEDEQIVERWSLFDKHAFLEQVGALEGHALRLGRL